MDKQKLLAIALDSAKQAGIEVMRHYRQGNYSTDLKNDHSPVTSADLAANELLMAQLQRLTPDIPIISEESAVLPLAQRKQWPRYWLLDPIDGTGEFILASGDFAVNIALVEQGWPSIGVIHAPAHKVTYYAQTGLGAFKETPLGSKQIQVQPYQGARNIRVAISRRQQLSLIQSYLNPSFDYQHIALGSCSLKNCLIAEGGADCYLRIGQTGEWDTGASHCILEQAGGSIIDSEFRSLSYNQRETLTNPDFLALGDGAFPWQQIIQAHRANHTC
jgi:3'(2'), 5'-bisphosphate nucleotidase